MPLINVGISTNNKSSRTCTDLLFGKYADIYLMAELSWFTNKCFGELEVLNPAFWWFGAVAPPVLIPNTAVKRSCGDDSLDWRK